MLTSVDATTDPRLGPPDNVVKVQGCSVDGLPRLADVRRPLGDGSAADAMPEDAENSVAEQATHDGPFRSARPRNGASVAECSCRQRSHPTNRGTTSSAMIRILALTVEGAMMFALNGTPS